MVQPARYAFVEPIVKNSSAAKSPRRHHNPSGCRGCNAVEDIGDWSNNILAEFNTIIANEIDELTRELERKRSKEEEARVVRYKELLNEFGISDSESSIGSSCEAAGHHFCRSTCSSRPGNNEIIRDRRNGKLFNDAFLLSYDAPPDRLVSARNDRRKSGSLPEDLQRLIGERARYYPSSPDPNLDDDDDARDPSSSAFVEDHRRVDLNTSSLPSKLDRGHASGGETEELKYLGNDQPKKRDVVEISSRGGEDEKRDGSSCSRVAGSVGPVVETTDESCAKLPPRQRDAHRKTSLPVNLTGGKRRRAPRLARIRRAEDPSQSAMDGDGYEAEEEKVGRSLDGNGPRSAPVTPTEEKKSPFSKILWKKHAPVFHESTDDVVLVRVSSLPDQDFLHLDNEASRAKNGCAKECGLSKKRAVSPLTLRSDISAKRLSESDKDVRQVSPVDLKKFSLSRSRGNDVGVSCDLPEDDNVGSIGSVDSGKFERVENVDVKKILDEQNSRSGSVSI